MGCLNCSHHLRTLVHARLGHCDHFCHLLNTWLSCLCLLTVLTSEPPSPTDPNIQPDTIPVFQKVSKGLKNQKAANFTHIMLAMVQSNYNFTLSCVITRVHVWLHGKSCCAPRYVAACPTATSNIVTCVHAWKLTATWL